MSIHDYAALELNPLAYAVAAIETKDKVRFNAGLAEFVREVIDASRAQNGEMFAVEYVKLPAKRIRTIHGERNEPCNFLQTSADKAGGHCAIMVDEPPYQFATEIETMSKVWRACEYASDGSVKRAARFNWL